MMGFNLYAYRVIDGKPNSITNKEWDFSRYACDIEFAHTKDFEWKYLPRDIHDTDVYARPKHIFRAIEWIHQNVIEECQPRLLNMMDKMNEDPTLYFHFSY